jgi:type II secretory pathway component PulF
MFSRSRISTSELAQLCRRLATSLEAGIDLRSVWNREAAQARGPTARERFRAVSEAINRGESVHDALAQTGRFFPPLFCELAEIGEQTGHVGESFRHLAEHYDQQLQIRRTFLASIAWPMLQLIASLAVIGFLIWIMGVIGQSGGNQIDPLGLGLIGNRGLVIYLAIVGLIAGAIAAIVQAMRSGLLFTQPIQRALLKVPGLGPALETLALARMAWSLHLAMDAGMTVRRALRLGVSSTRNAYFLDDLARIDQSIEQGNSIYETLADTGRYPREFLDTVQVGEQSGRLVESLKVLSRQYHQRADIALRTLTMIAGFAVWGMIATVIIFFIFRLFMFYIGQIQSAMRP